MAMEEEGPSKTLIILAILPPVLLFIIYHLVEGFTTKPKSPPFMHAILPLILAILSVVFSVFGFFAAKDEEPEWGSALPYKSVEALSIGYILISLVFAGLVVILYFLG